MSTDPASSDHRPIRLRWAHKGAIATPTDPAPLPMRQKPFSHTRELILPISFLIVFSVLTVFPLISLFGRMPLSIGCWVMWYAFLAPIWYLQIRALRKVFGPRRLLNRGSATAVARILDRHVFEHKDEYGRGYTHYFVQFEFNALLADKDGGSIALGAEVRKDMYDRLEPGMSVNVRYATQNPRVVLLEGE